ncbi:hypothetical protein Ahy_B01g057121 [Arachis hypogaea]|uniref:Uncharacterized protein n=1 Tax=Arachis hypogaea TaxID=3818 RepID=A0A445B0B7_ARAHY|nr:hypothetical protein Ahy_B01g057121 [Arachis hypogaea]
MEIKHFCTPLSLRELASVTASSRLHDGDNSEPAADATAALSPSAISGLTHGSSLHASFPAKSTAMARHVTAAAVPFSVPFSSLPSPSAAISPLSYVFYVVCVSGGGEVGIVDRVPTSLQCAAPAGMGDALLDDVDDDNVEPDLIGDDSGDEIAASNPAGAGGGSSSGTQQYPPHFLSLDLDAMRQEGYLEAKSQLNVSYPAGLNPGKR